MTPYVVALDDDDLEALAVGEVTLFLRAIARFELLKRARNVASSTPADGAVGVGLGTLRACPDDDGDCLPVVARLAPVTHGEHTRTVPPH